MFKEGDIVQIKSGGPIMTVCSTDYEDSTYCTWYENGEVKTAVIMNSALKKADSEAPAAVV